MQVKKIPKNLLHPKYWLSWLIAGFIYVLVIVLPYTWLMKLGAGIGCLMEKLIPYRLSVAKTNIRLCFEGRRDKDWQVIYRQHVISLGKGVFEMAMGWFLPASHFDGRVKHIGYEDADKALSEGRGVLFLGAHTTGLDFGAPLLNNRYPVYFMYKAAKNAVLNFIIMRGRLRNCPGVIEQTNLREVLRRLKNGECVWYGSDQDFGAWTKSVFASFYGVSALTLASYAKIAQKTGAVVIPVAGFRDEESEQFVVRYLPQIKVDNLCDKQAAIVMNENIEILLSGYEAQYYWVHRRFKTRPDNEPDIYPRKPSHIRREQRMIKQAARRAKKGHE
ncbi:MAG: LpxL/LpxP family acyltransferase [Ostreibacterium sp.]